MTKSFILTFHQVKRIRLSDLSETEPRKYPIMATISLPTSNSSERSRILAVDLMRRRALDRLYERRAAVETLIQSLEDYQKIRDARLTQSVDFTAARKCS
jgi:hypothetical protein